MPDLYRKVGENGRFYFLVRDLTTGLADTTFVAGDFTLQIGKELAGNQSTTGCTFGVLDSTNNAGVAYIDCSGSTSFLSATGNYAVKVFRTASATQIWTATVRVTNDGTGSGSWGSASFTATASNGRTVIAGPTALADVTIRILNPSGVLYVQTTSDSNGLWGPVYFNANGTYTIQAQKSSYTLATGTITVSGSTATGPGADLTLALSSSSSTLLASELWAYARRMLQDNTGAKADVEVREAVDDALAYLAMVKQWPYLQDFGRIDLVAEYTAGTVAITNGSATVTLTGGTWPPWAANGVIYVAGSWATVSTRDSGTVLTLTAAWGEATVTAATYTIARHSYTLPTNLQRIDKILFAQDWPYEREVSAATLEYTRTAWNAGDVYPTCWAVRGDQFLVWPWPTTTHRVNILYYKRPALLTVSSDVAEWDPNQLMLLRRSIDYQCSLRGRCVAGTPQQCLATLDDAISQAWSWDRTGADRSLNDQPGYGDDLLRGTIETS